MSHHYSGPDYGFPNGDSRLDLTDLYAFPARDTAGKSILVMNVHPSASVNPAVPTTAEPFAPDARYELKIDTDGDAMADLALHVRFFSPGGGPQSATLRRIVGAAAAQTGGDGEIIIEAAPVSVGREALVTQAGDYRLFAGWRSDPFFFDTLGALNQLQFTGDDFFARKDVCSIVLEVPNSVLGGKRVGLWHRTLALIDGEWVQADRGALPSQSIFLTGASKAMYLAGDPVDDQQFVPVFAHSLEHTGGYTPEQAKQIAKRLLPDILTYDPGLPASYPINGRALTDDVMDHFISLITNGRITRDQVEPHRDLLTSFPYLGAPHEVRTGGQTAREE